MIVRSLAVLLCLIPSMAMAVEPPRASWGKAGVTFDQYRADAAECTRAGLSTDVADMRAVKTLIAASRQLDAVLGNQTMPSTGPGNGMSQIDPTMLNTAQQAARIREGANPEARFREVRTALQTTTDTCLNDRGYVRFTLTRDQRARLGKLRPGTAERHAYLYALASDAGILERQRATVEVLPDR